MMYTKSVSTVYLNKKCFICILDKNKLQLTTISKNQNQKNISYIRHRNNLNQTKVISTEMYKYILFLN